MSDYSPLTDALNANGSELAVMASEMVAHLAQEVATLWECVDEQGRIHSALDTQIGLLGEISEKNDVLITGQRKAIEMLEATIEGLRANIVARKKMDAAQKEIIARLQVRLGMTEAVHAQFH